MSSKILYAKITKKEKEMDTEKAGTLGTGFFSLMFLMFLGLKISGMIDWDWIWVFAPIWVPFLVAVAIIGIMFLIMAISAGAKSGKKN